MAADLPVDHEQLNLFPLHPEPIIHDRHDDNENCPASELLRPYHGTEESMSHSPTGSSLGSLAKAALRGRERWAYCQEEEEEEVEEEGEASSRGGSWLPTRGMLCLKLDYEEVLSAWSDKSPLYIDGEAAAQVVPDYYCRRRRSHHEHFLNDSVSVFVGVGGNTSGNRNSFWQVPERGEGGGGGGGRKARVMRYKEKRQNRLFSKRTRYEVRKLNAEKRPRIKGRFVKRMEEED